MTVLLLFLLLVISGVFCAGGLLGYGRGRIEQEAFDADLFDRRLTLALQLRDSEWKRALNEPTPKVAAASFFDWEVDA